MRHCGALRIETPHSRGGAVSAPVYMGLVVGVAGVRFERTCRRGLVWAVGRSNTMEHTYIINKKFVCISPT